MKDTFREKKTMFEKAPEWMTLLRKSEAGDRDYAPTVEGQIPKGLRGSLYRNGPGLFERGGDSIQHLLDGDGLIQRLSFTDDGVRYQNQFVQTEKFMAEQTANKRLYATWSSRIFNDSGDRNIISSQAHITVYPVHGKVIARDELGPSYEIHPETLETVGPVSAGQDIGAIKVRAHSKIDPETGEWILAGVEYGPSMKLHVVTYASNFKPKSQFSVETPRRMVYIHDFMASKQHIIFVLHPCFPSFRPYLRGLKSLIDSFEWKPEKGNIITVVPRDGGTPSFFEASGSFMWHSLNAYDQGDEIIADFVGFDGPDHFIGDNAFMANIMRGNMGRAESPGTIRRYTINFRSGKLTEEVLDAANHEFPMIDGRVAMARQRFGYFTCGGLGAYHSGLKRLDYETGNIVRFVPTRKAEKLIR